MTHIASKCVSQKKIQLYKSLLHKAIFGPVGDYIPVYWKQWCLMGSCVIVKIWAIMHPFHLSAERNIMYPWWQLSLWGSDVGALYISMTNAQYIKVITNYAILIYYDKDFTSISLPNNLNSYMMYWQSEYNNIFVFLLYILHEWKNKWMNEWGFRPQFYFLRLYWARSNQGYNG